MQKRLFKGISILLVLTLLFTCTVSAFAYSGRIDPDIIAETSKTALKIEAEGIVLLKNEDNVLPLDGKKLNVFGVGSVCPFFGGCRHCGSSVFSA